MAGVFASGGALPHVIINLLLHDDAIRDFPVRDQRKNLVGMLAI